MALAGGVSSPSPRLYFGPLQTNSPHDLSLIVVKKSLRMVKIKKGVKGKGKGDQKEGKHTPKVPAKTICLHFQQKTWKPLVEKNL